MSAARRVSRPLKFFAPELLSLAALVLMPGAVCAQNAAALGAAQSPLYATEEDSHDAAERSVMPMTTAPPWGAVGFLDNGCSAALIDANHILAASHCFTFDYDGTTAAGVPYLQGAWQKGLTFFPNYHPNRANPPRVAVDRVIVGSRVQSDPAVAADWAIGHLATAVTDFPSVALQPMERWRFPNFVTFAGYPRDAAVYPQGNNSFPEPSPGGYCANFKNNCWWIPAFIDHKCLALEDTNGFVRSDEFSCLTLGGNSGSPVFWNIGSAAAPQFRITGVISGGGGFWNASRFQYAPRRAAGVALAAHDSGGSLTQVFATDADLDRVVSRSRAAAGVGSPFNFFESRGTVPKPGALAAFRLKSGKPQVVVISGASGLYTRHVGANGLWTSWQLMTGPVNVRSFADVAATLDNNGLPCLYVVGGDGFLYANCASSATAGATWGAWTKRNFGVHLKRVAVVRHTDGRQQLFVSATTGQVRTSWQSGNAPGSPWTAPTVFTQRGSPGLVDLDATWTVDGRVQVFALDETGQGWTRIADTSSPSGAWSAWSQWSVPLYAPAAATPPAIDELVSLTAGRWLESKTVAPVVFATDRQGNIYVTSFVNNAWQPWRSFYN